MPNPSSLIFLPLQFAAESSGFPSGHLARVARFDLLTRNPYVAAGRGYIDDVIEPHETRPRLINALEMLSNKRDTNPAKKHGNIPL